MFNAAYIILSIILTGDYPGELGTGITEDSTIVDILFTLRELILR